MRLTILVVLLVAGLAVGACSDGENGATQPPPEPTLRFTSGEVETLFIEWACPGSNVLAASVYRPRASYQGGAWQIETQRGYFTAREPQLIFVPSEEAATYSQILRSGVGCR